MELSNAPLVSRANTSPLTTSVPIRHALPIVQSVKILLHARSVITAINSLMEPVPSNSVLIIASNVSLQLIAVFVMMSSIKKMGNVSLALKTVSYAKTIPTAMNATPAIFLSMEVARIPA